MASNTGHSKTSHSSSTGSSPHRHERERESSHSKSHHHHHRSSRKQVPTTTSMSTQLKSLFSSAISTISGSTTPTRPVDYIFPKVDRTVDGDDCDHDCESCEVKLPRGWKIDEDDQLYGMVKGWSTHIIIATGKTDWVRDVEDEKGSVMQAFGKSDIKPKNGRLMLSASNIPTPTHHNDYSEPTTVVLLPAFIVIDHVTPKSVPALIERFINEAPTNTTPLETKIPPTLIDPLPTADGMIAHSSPHRALILLCSHKTRDARCGQSAPLLRKELERHLRPLGLFRDLDDERPGGVGIYFINHVGGHKYSANMMVYRRPDAFGLDSIERAQFDGDTCPLPVKGPIEEDKVSAGAAQCIWLARVRPEDCEGIIKFTVLQGKVVKPERQLRGGFDRSKDLLSW